MKALRYFGPGSAEIEELPTPELGPGEVLVAARACGICGTDVKTFKRGHLKIPPGDVLGHEVAGDVIASNSPDFVQGERVVVAPYAPCLTCESCKRGHFSLCENLFDTYLDPGGFAEQVRVPSRIVAQGLLHIPDGLDYATASLTEPLACCLHGLEAVNVQPGRSLLIIGDGPMGLLQAVLARYLGADPIILSGLIPHRLNVARKIVDVVVDVSDTDLSRVLAATTPGGADHVMVSVADVGVAQDALKLVRKGGAVNLFAGLPRDTIITLDPNRIHYDQVKILGTFGFGPDHFRRVADLLADGALDVSDLLTGRVALSDVKDALEAAGRFKGIKTVVMMGGDAPSDLD